MKTANGQRNPNDQYQMHNALTYAGYCHLKSINPDLVYTVERHNGPHVYFTYHKASRIYFD